MLSRASLSRRQVDRRGRVADEDAHPNLSRHEIADVRADIEARPVFFCLTIGTELIVTELNGAPPSTTPARDVPGNEILIDAEERWARRKRHVHLAATPAASRAPAGAQPTRGARVSRPRRCALRGRSKKSGLGICAVTVGDSFFENCE